MSLSKTSTSICAPTAVSAGAEYVSSAIDVRTFHAGLLLIDWGCTATTAPVGSGAEINIEVSEDGSNVWRVLVPMTASTAAATTCTLRGTDKTLGQTVIECNTVVPALSSIALIVPATVANSEFHRVVGRSTTSGSETFTIPSPGFSAAIAVAGANVYAGAASFVIPVDLLGVQYVRVRVNNNAGTTNVAGIIRASITKTVL